MWGTPMYPHIEVLCTPLYLQLLCKLHYFHTIPQIILKIKIFSLEVYKSLAVNDQINMQLARGRGGSVIMSKESVTKGHEFDPACPHINPNQNGQRRIGSGENHCTLNWLEKLCSFFFRKIVIGSRDIAKNRKKRHKVVKTP